MRSPIKALLVLMLAFACMMFIAVGCGDDDNGPVDNVVLDADNDGVADSEDNCPNTPNTDQINTDGDSQGNACDNDDDNDGVLDAADNCPLVANPGQAYICENDDDGDGILNDVDNCPQVANPDQADADGDGIGNACDPGAEACMQAAAIVSMANDSLGDQIYHMIEVTLSDPDSTFRPREIDFTDLNNIYLQAAGMCPTSLDAKFGAAFTGMMVFMQDQTLDDLIDRFKHTYDTLQFNPFENLNKVPGVIGGGPLTPNGLPMSTSGLLEVIPGVFELDRMLVRVAATDPVISELQATMENNLLPIIVQARTYMADLLTYPDYTFRVTTHMQGNQGSDDIVLDRSDFEVLQAALYGAEAMMRVFFARDLDLASYVSPAGWEQAASRSSSFLSLKPGGVGQNHMTTAKSMILSAAGHVDNALDNLIAEVGTDQYNDWIQVYPNDLSDLYEIKDSLAYYLTYFNGPKELSIVYNEDWWGYWNGYEWIEYYSADTFTTMVDISKFFDVPLENPKLFIPAYTVSITAVEDLYKDYAGQHFSRSRYWDSMSTIFGLTYPNDTAVWTDDTRNFYNHLPDINSEEFYSLLAEESYYWGSYTDVGGRQFIFGWDDVYFYGGDRRYVWNYYSHQYWDYIDLYRNPDQVVACYSWDANTWAEWTIPDPTFNGLLPDMTEFELKDMILDDPGDFQKSDCDTLDFD